MRDDQPGGNYVVVERPLIREGLKRIIEREPGLVWCSDAESFAGIQERQRQLVLTLRL